MKLFRKIEAAPATLGVFPGGFNPPTSAHLALAWSALSRVDQLLFVLPRKFPHKIYAGATLPQRLDMLDRITAGEPRFSVGVSEKGLFVEMARECREHFPHSRLWFLCGRDAAERIVDWDYGATHSVDEMLREFGLLVAPRSGVYVPPDRLQGNIDALPLTGLDAVSSTEVRQRIRNNRPWRELVPEQIADLVAGIYSGQPASRNALSR